MGLASGPASLIFKTLSLIKNHMMKKKAYHDVHVEPVDDKTEHGLAFETQISEIGGGHRRRKFRLHHQIICSKKELKRWRDGEMESGHKRG